MDEFNEWDIKLAEFRGATISSLKNINKELQEMNKRIRRIEERLIKLNIRVATIAGTISLIVFIVGIMIQTIL